MALSQYWVSRNRKDLAERAIVSRRQAEAHSAHRRESAARFHRELNLLSTQYRNIEDGLPGKTQRVNHQSSVDEEARAKSKERLLQRQQKLMLLLAQENEKFLRELKAISDEECQKDPWSLATLKEQIEDLRRRRKHDEEVLAKKSMAHLYHMNDDVFINKKKTESLEREVQQACEQKKQEMKKLAAEKAENEKNRKVALEEQLISAKKCAEDALVEREEVRSQHESKLKELSKEAAEHLSQCEKLEVDIGVLRNHQKILEGVIKKRKDVKDIQKQRTKRIEMFRKSKEKVRKMAAEVRHLLEIDLATLDFLSQLEGSHKESSAKLDLEIVAATKELVKNMMAEEDKRDAELQILFEEEAVKMMNKREQAWNTQLEIHEKNICNVFEALDSQIKNKIDECVESQKKHMESHTATVECAKEEKEKWSREDRELVAKHEFYVNKMKQLDEQIKTSAMQSAKLPRLRK